jgi:indole-3-acetate O-methyltransferase
VREAVVIEVRMRGDGYYSASCGGQGLVIDRALPLILEAIDALDPASSDAVFAIADFGAADGGTSIGMFHALLTELRKRAPDRPITLTHTDLPYNDFSTLFRLVHGLLPGREADGLRNFHGVFSFASGTSFHQQIFPDATLSLGFSASAMHWLSRLPTPLVDHVHAATASGAERAAFAAQAAADWEAILLHRARELVPGGQLVFANFCSDEAGRYSGATGGRNLFETLARLWRALHEDGTIMSEELSGATFMQYNRTIAEYRAPFDDPASAVSRAGLVLEHCSSVITPIGRFVEGEDAAAFAAKSASSLRAFSESTFFGALDPGRPQTERQVILDRFYRAYEAEVASAPRDYYREAVNCFMRVAKVL